MPIVCHGGFFDPATYLRLESLFTQLHVDDLPDVAGEIQRWIGSHGDLVLTVRQESAARRRILLSDWGELLVCELLAIACAPHTSPAARRRRIADALRMAEGGTPS